MKLRNRIFIPLLILLLAACSGTVPEGTTDEKNYIVTVGTADCSVLNFRSFSSQDEIIRIIQERYMDLSGFAEGLTEDYDINLYSGLYPLYSDAFPWADPSLAEEEASASLAEDAGNGYTLRYGEEYYSSMPKIISTRQKEMADFHTKAKGEYYLTGNSGEYVRKEGGENELNILEGRTFTDEEVEQGEMVCVILSGSPLYRLKEGKWEEIKTGDTIHYSVFVRQNDELNIMGSYDYRVVGIADYYLTLQKGSVVQAVMIPEKAYMDMFNDSYQAVMSSAPDYSFASDTLFPVEGVDPRFYTGFLPAVYYVKTDKKLQEFLSRIDSKNKDAVIYGYEYKSADVE